MSSLPLGPRLPSGSGTLPGLAEGPTRPTRPTRINKDASLQAALSRMVAADGLTLASAVEVTDAAVAAMARDATEDHDPHVTAVRRLSAVPAEYAPMPAG